MNKVPTETVKESSLFVNIANYMPSILGLVVEAENKRLQHDDSDDCVMHSTSKLTDGSTYHRLYEKNSEKPIIGLLHKGNQSYLLV